MRIINFFVVMCLITIADQFSKFWITTNLAPDQSLPETGFFRLNHVQNTGVVFGLFNGNNASITFLVVVEAVLILFYFFFISGRYPFLNTRLNTMASGLILGGLIGNLIDRIRLGHVTDFISVGPWPNFNFADLSGVIGAFLLAFSILLFSRQNSFKYP